jgi:hypothetical protein
MVGTYYHRCDADGYRQTLISRFQGCDHLSLYVNVNVCGNHECVRFVYLRSFKCFRLRLASSSEVLPAGASDRSAFVYTRSGCSSIELIKI